MNGYHRISTSLCRQNKLAFVFASLFDDCQEGQPEAPETASERVTNAIEPPEILSPRGELK